MKMIKLMVFADCKSWKVSKKKNNIFDLILFDMDENVEICSMTGLFFIAK